MTPFDLTPVADVGVMMRFGNTICAEAEAAVATAHRTVHRSKLPGVTETIPSYTALFIGYDPLVTDAKTLCTTLRELDFSEQELSASPKVWEVPVCYEEPYATDLKELCTLLGKSRDQIVGEHLSGSYVVSMYGFAPGYAYMRGVPESLQIPRKPKPVADVPAGSVIVAGPQCLVTTLTLPSGWWTIGYSPFEFLRRHESDQFPVAVGSEIQFRRVSLEELSKVKTDQ